MQSWPSCTARGDASPCPRADHEHEAVRPAAPPLHHHAGRGGPGLRRHRQVSVGVRGCCCQGGPSGGWARGPQPLCGEPEGFVLETVSFGKGETPPRRCTSLFIAQGGLGAHLGLSRAPQCQRQCPGAMGRAASSPRSPVRGSQALVFLGTVAACQGRRGGTWLLPARSCHRPEERAAWRGAAPPGGGGEPRVCPRVCPRVPIWLTWGARRGAGLPSATLPLVLLLLAVGQGCCSLVSPCPASGFTLW